MKITEFRKLIREEVRKVIKEAVSKPIGLPYDNGKMAAQIIAAATQLGMKQGPYVFGKPSGDYSFEFDQMDGDDGEKVVVKGGKGVGDKNGNNPSAVFILNPKMQSDPTIQALTKKAKSKYNEVRKVTEVVDMAPKSLQGKHRDGSIIVALFFDHTKIQNNSNKLWNIVLATAEPAGCTVTKYFVTDTVAEFEFRLESGGGYDPAVNTIEKGLSKVKGMVTNMDIYTV